MLAVDVDKYYSNVKNNNKFLKINVTTLLERLY